MGGNGLHGIDPAARAHRLKQRGCVFGQQDKDRREGLFKHLEQGILRLLIHQVGTVDDKNLERALRRCNKALHTELADILYLDVFAVFVKKDDVGMRSGSCLDAGGANAAGAAAVSPA